MDWLHPWAPQTLFIALGNTPTSAPTWRHGTGAHPITWADLLYVNVQLWAQFSEQFLCKCLCAFAHAVPFTWTPHCLVSSSLLASAPRSPLL